jgi:hypothetical protein
LDGGGLSVTPEGLWDLSPEHPQPLHPVSALVKARAAHTGRSARNHLLAMAATAGIGGRRVKEVIDMVGLTDVASSGSVRSR